MRRVAEQVAGNERVGNVGGDIGAHAGAHEQRSGKSGQRVGVVACCAHGGRYSVDGCNVN